MNLDDMLKPGVKLNVTAHTDKADIDLGIRTIDRVTETGFFSIGPAGTEHFTPMRCMADVELEPHGFSLSMDGTKRFTYTFVSAA